MLRGILKQLEEFIIYKLEHTSPPQKRGRKRIYRDAR